MFNGEYKEIEQSRRPPNTDARLLSFHRRKPWVYGQPQEMEWLRDQLKQVSKHIRFGLCSGYTNPWIGMSHQARNSYVCGQTVDLHFPGQEFITCYISIETLQPLLRTDLTDAEWCVFSKGSQLL